MSRIFSALVSIFFVVFSFLRPVVGSVNGGLIPAEIKRAVIAGLAASSISGFGVLALQSIAGDSTRIFTSPTTAAFVAGLLTHLAALIGQLPQSRANQTIYQGSDSAYLDQPLNPASPRPIVRLIAPSDDPRRIIIDGPTVLQSVSRGVIAPEEARSILFPGLSDTSAASLHP